MFGSVSSFNINNTGYRRYKSFYTYEQLFVNNKLIFKIHIFVLFLTNTVPILCFKFKLQRYRDLWTCIFLIFISNYLFWSQITNLS